MEGDYAITLHFALRFHLLSVFWVSVGVVRN
jgi:hypothetical protein